MTGASGSPAVVSAVHPILEPVRKVGDRQGAISSYQTSVICSDIPPTADHLRFGRRALRRCQKWSAGIVPLAIVSLAANAEMLTGRASCRG